MLRGTLAADKENPWKLSSVLSFFQLSTKANTESECPRNSLTKLPADRSHRRMRRSSPADTRYCPSGEIARSCIEPYKQTHIIIFTVNPLFNPPPSLPGRLIYFKHLWEGGLNRDGERIREGGLFNLAKMVVSALHKEPEWKVEKLNTGSWSSYNWGSKTNPTFQHVNKPSWISPLQCSFTVYHLLVKNNKGRGDGGAY